MKIRTTIEQLIELYATRLEESGVFLACMGLLAIVLAVIAVASLP